MLHSRCFLSVFSEQVLFNPFQDCVNPICSCGQEIETSTHFLLRCSNYQCARQTLLKKKIDSTNLKQNDQVITKLLLFGNQKLKVAQNKSILTSTMDFLQATERFKTSLFNLVANGMVPLTHCQF